MGLKLRINYGISNKIHSIYQSIHIEISKLTITFYNITQNNIKLNGSI